MVPQTKIQLHDVASNDCTATKSLSLGAIPATCVEFRTTGKARSRDEKWGGGYLGCPGWMLVNGLDPWVITPKDPNILLTSWDIQVYLGGAIRQGSAVGTEAKKLQTVFGSMGFVYSPT